MSLRGKIIALFLALAVVPLLVVAGFGYWQSAKLARDVVDVALNATVSDLAQELERAMEDLELRVDRLAGDPRLGRLPSDSTARSAWEEDAAASLGELAFVSVRGRAGDLAVAGSRPEQMERCNPGRGGARLHVERRSLSPGDQPLELEAGVWLDDLVPRQSLRVAGSVLVFERGQGEVLYSSSCDELVAGVPSGLRAGQRRTGSTRFEFQGEDRLASFVTLQDPVWQVAAHARTNAFLAPLQQLQASYWIFVLMLALATALAFSILLDRVVMSLEDLTAAAARIGEGELNPWLPPPGDDEVGRLSLAFSGMLERVRQMMQRVDQSGRLAVVGQLTSYLAHEIRNPLSSIRMNLQSLQRDARRGKLPEDSEEAIQISLREVDRLTSSLTSVLQLGRPTSGAREVVSVHDVVEDAAELLAGEFRRCQVELDLGLDAGADRVTAATGQLKGVFLNLMMNALESQPDGGRVEIRSQLVSSPTLGPTVAVHVRDFGRGIPPELRDRVFEPFFTTKSQGSGIGLAVALRTVREHGGDLFVSDLPETARGTEFVVELPLAAVAVESPPEPTVALPDWMGAGRPGEVPDSRWEGRGADAGKGPSLKRIDDPHLRALIELTDPDHGELH